MSNRRKAKHKNYIITLQNNRRAGLPPNAICECGWMSEPNESLTQLGREAKRHSVQTGHKLRNHNDQG